MAYIQKSIAQLLDRMVMCQLAARLCPVNVVDCAINIQTMIHVAAELSDLFLHNMHIFHGGLLFDRVVGLV